MTLFSFLLLTVLFMTTKSLDEGSFDTRYYHLKYQRKMFVFDQRSMRTETKLLSDIFSKNKRLFTYASTKISYPYIHIKIKDGQTLPYLNKVNLKIQLSSKDFQNLKNPSQESFHTNETKLITMHEQINSSDSNGNTKVTHAAPTSILYDLSYKDGTQIILKSNQMSLSLYFQQIEPSEYMKQYKIYSYYGLFAALGFLVMLKLEWGNKSTPKRYRIDPLLYFYVLQTLYSTFIDEIIFHFFDIFPSSIQHIVPILQILVWIVFLLGLSPNFHKYQRNQLIYFDFITPLLLCVSYVQLVLIIYTIYHIVMIFLNEKKRSQDKSYSSRKTMWSLATIMLIILLKFRKDVDLRHFQFMFQQIPFSSFAPSKINYYQMVILVFNLILSLPAISTRIFKLILRFWNIIRGYQAYSNVFQEDQKQKDHEQLYDRVQRASKRHEICLE